MKPGHVQMGPVQVGPVQVGNVATFDADAGFGTVRDDDGREHFFHCTQIAGGTRSIDEGVRVVFVLAPGHRGLWEAARVTPV